MDSRHFDEIPAPLPLDRLQMSNPFTKTGVDFAGPFPVESPANSGHKTKVYVCLFTCTITRAVHLEATTDQEISTFIFALRRFFARREYPRALYSDNAGTLTLAAKYLRAAYRDSRVFNTLVDLNIKWRFSPSLAPWWGGFWERMVQTFKRLLYKTYGSDCMEYDLFQTVLTEIEDTINTRPLTYVAEDDTEPLTPKQLVTGYRQQQHHPVDDEEREYSDRVTLTKRERLRRNLVAQWWKDFYTEYVMDLEQFHCPTPGHTKEIELGQVVLIHDESAKRTRWKSGRVVKLIPGNDGKTRRVNVLIADKFRGIGSTMITRDPKSLYPLELHAGQIDDDHRNTGPYEDSELSSTQLDQGPTEGVSEIPMDEAHSHRQGANPLAEEG
ncbi:uncharacterized protein LOC116927549 [Daphnia magna]|uniref:uncharacterized protein LOC116927549 n=1 Tax=Daphnia magna TaxID=35525 RepID=UPI001E1BA1DB|nr:uncharacterized protein LOC116927549 [Daphnia magna]